MILKTTEMSLSDPHYHFSFDAQQESGIRETEFLLKISCTMHGTTS